ncbi:MAG: hypothetical protein FWD37_05030, partial [Methanomassiliicoccaceae archaeon]|nr:hypothetical protein [Methanomassiliicoccaceae archaeon]
DSLEAVGGVYTIEDITASFAITVSGVSKNTYNVTLASGTGYTLAAKEGSSSPVEYGGSFTFVFSLNLAYSDSGYTIKVNGTGVDLTDGEYTITNITEAKVVTVEGVVIDDPNIYPDVVTDEDGTTATVKEGEMEKSVDKIKDSGDELILNIVVPSDASSKKAVVEMPASGLSYLADEGGKLSIDTPAGTVTFSKEALSAIADDAKEDGTSVIMITIEKMDISFLNQKQKQKVGDNPVFSITATVDGTSVTVLNGHVTVTLPYVLKTGQDPSLLFVWYVDELGNIERFECTYNAIAKTVSFVTDHFSYYVIMYPESSGDDTPKDDGGFELDTMMILIIAAVVGLVIAASFFVFRK